MAGIFAAAGAQPGAHAAHQADWLAGASAANANAGAGAALARL